MAGRYCVGPVDAIYHTVFVLHAALPELLLLAALTALAVAGFRFARLDAHLKALETVATEAPLRLVAAFDAEARRVSHRTPRLLFVPVDRPLCFIFTARHWAIVVSRGFLERLDNDELDLVARHELAHVRRGDMWRSLAWHLAFGTLLFPGFGDLERRLADARERQADAVAAQGNAVFYAELTARMRGLCATPAATARQPRPLGYLAAPSLALVTLLALGASHAEFMSHETYLATHHC